MIPMSPPSSPPLPSWASRSLGVAGQLLLWLMLWFGLVRIPAPASPGLDPSWRMALGYAVEHQFQFGVDLVFTYGPLGYLLPTTNSGGLYGHHLFWQLGMNAVFATVIWFHGRSFRGWRLALFYAYFLAFGVTYGDALHLTMVLLLSTALLREPVAARRWLAALAGLLLAVLALVKFTNFMLAGFAVACVCTHHAWRRRWADLLVVIGSTAGPFLAGWMLWGQSVANLPAYVINSLSISAGYGEGMAIYETPTVFWLGLGAAVCVGSYYVLTLWRRDDLPRGLALVAIAGATSFLNWKHGYIRADGHVFAHYISCLLIAACYPALLEDGAHRRVLKGALLSAAAGFSLAGAFVVSANAITDAPAIYNYQVKGIVNWLRIIHHTPRNGRAEFASASNAHGQPGIRSWVGDESVDMMGNEQSVLLFTGLNYRPRPVLQSYSTYSPRLLRLNEAFYRSARAPRYVVQRLDPIDYRLPALDDSLATLTLYQRYDYITNEAGYLVWRRHEPAREPAAPVELSTATVGFGEAVSVPADGEHPIWAEVDVRPSLLGRIRSFLYKAPIVQMRVTEEGQAAPKDYRIIPGMARTGFLLYPHFTSGGSIEDFQRMGRTPRVQSFSIEMPPAQRKYFRRGITVRFSRLAPLPRNDKAVASQVAERKFRVFDRPPTSAAALYPITLMTEGTTEVISAHPPSTLEFNVDFPAERVRGRFGLSQSAYTPPNQTDGVEFVLEWISADGSTRRLFERILAPSAAEADRGLQDFDVALPPGGGRLVLRTTPGPNNDLSFDWAFWTGVDFLP